MQVTAKVVWKLADELLGKLMDMNGVEHEVSIAPSPCFAMWYMIEAR